MHDVKDRASLAGRLKTVASFVLAGLGTLCLVALLTRLNGHRYERLQAVEAWATTAMTNPTPDDCWPRRLVRASGGRWTYGVVELRNRFAEFVLRGADCRDDIYSGEFPSREQLESLVYDCSPLDVETWLETGEAEDGVVVLSRADRELMLATALDPPPWGSWLRQVNARPPEWRTADLARARIGAVQLSPRTVAICAGAVELNGDIWVFMVDIENSSLGPVEVAYPLSSDVPFIGGGEDL